MAVTVTFKGVTYVVPSPGGTNDWGDSLTAFLVALAATQPAAKLTLTGTAARAPLRLEPSDEPTGPNEQGDLYMSLTGVVKVCTVAGSPGTWVSVGGQT